MSQPVLSIIIPVYNVEQYIHECLSSIKTHDKDDLEVIVVNDGATDSSYDIAKKFADDSELDIKVISQKNAGLSAARNTGIKQAKGRYILFLDSDDILDSAEFHKLTDLLKTTDKDIVIGGYKKLTGHLITSYQRNIDKDTFNSLNTEKALDVLAGQYDCIVWINAYKRELITDNGLFFPEGLLHEDVFWTPKLLNHAKSFYFSGLVWYVYRVREGSIMTTFSVKKDMHKFICAEAVFREAGICRSKKMRKKLYKIANDLVRTPIRNLSRYEKEEAARILDEAGKHKKILFYPVCPQNIIRYAAVALLGVAGFAYLNNLLKKKKK